MGELTSEDVVRRATVQVYRQIAARLMIEAAVLEAQAQSFEDAAARIEKGELPAVTLRAVADEAPKGKAEVQREDRREEERERIVRAVVRASRRPAHELPEAGIDRLREEAGFGEDDVDDFKQRMDELLAWGHVASYPVEGEPHRVFLPTEQGFASIGAAVPVPGTRHPETIFGITAIKRVGRAGVPS